MDEKAVQTIQERQQKEKQLLLEQFKKTPIVQIACEKSDISRATYYRWRKEDQEFASAADDALGEGSLLVNDLAESQLMVAIREKNLTAITFWLKHHHPVYATRVEITNKTKREDEILTPEQEAVLKKALQLANLLPEENQQEPETQKEEEKHE